VYVDLSPNDVFNILWAQMIRVQFSSLSSQQPVTVTGVNPSADRRNMPP